MPAMSPAMITMMAFQAAGAVVSTIGAVQQAQAQRAQANYKAAVALNNAITAQQTAAAIGERGVVAAADHRRRIAQAKGRAKVHQAAAGTLVDDTFGTNVQLLGDIAEMGELDILRIFDNVALEKRRADIQGVNYRAQAGLFDAKAGSINPLAAGTSSLISGATATAALGTKFGGSKPGSIFFTG